MDKKKITAMAHYIDLNKASKAYSIQPYFVHCRIWLLPTKPLYGLGFTLIKNRHNSTRVATSSSEPLTITRKVPQGSILGLILFSLYMNDLTELIKFSNFESSVDNTWIKR